MPSPDLRDHIHWIGKTVNYDGGEWEVEDIFVTGDIYGDFIMFRLVRVVGFLRDRVSITYQQLVKDNNEKE